MKSEIKFEISYFAWRYDLERKQDCSIVNFDILILQFTTKVVKDELVSSLEPRTLLFCDLCHRSSNLIFQQNLNHVISSLNKLRHRLQNLIAQSES